MTKTREDLVRMAEEVSCKDMMTTLTVHCAHDVERLKRTVDKTTQAFGHLKAYGIALEELGVQLTADVQASFEAVLKHLYDVMDKTNAETASLHHLSNQLVRIKKSYIKREDTGIEYLLPNRASQLALLYVDNVLMKMYGVPTPTPQEALENTRKDKLHKEFLHMADARNTSYDEFYKWAHSIPKEDYMYCVHRAGEEDSHIGKILDEPVPAIPATDAEILQARFEEVDGHSSYETFMQFMSGLTADQVKSLQITSKDDVCTAFLKQWAVEHGLDKPAEEVKKEEINACKGCPFANPNTLACELARAFNVCQKGLK